MTEQATVGQPMIEHHREPLGIGEPAPRISWITRTKSANWRQTAYEISSADPRVAGSAVTTGRVRSAESLLIAWPFPPLASRARHAVSVRVWGAGESEPSDWSEPATLEAGLLDPADWVAELVSPELPGLGESGEPAALLRGEFELPAAPVGARARISGHGLLQLYLNGSPVSDELLTPGWSSYTKRLRYRTYDVTELLQSGLNAAGVELADGWWRGYIGTAGDRNVYGDSTGALVQIEVELDDGSLQIVGSDGSWRSTLGPTVRADLYLGETYDARRRIDGWSEPGFRDSEWTPVSVSDVDMTALVAPTGPPVRRTEVVAAQSIFRSPSGATLIDFGQNLVGRLRVQVPVIPAGKKVTFKHAEVLEDGELCTRPLRRASQTDVVISNGTEFVWEPTFTVHGFRFVEVDGWPGLPSPDDIEAVVLHTDLRRTGRFSCSDPLLARLHENVVWSMRGNFVDVPTDCPQRDERLGWTGDIQVFAPTASFLYDSAGMLSGWLSDLEVDQLDDGIVPPWVPWCEIGLKRSEFGAEAGWGDAATFVPWTIYERYGDVEILRRQWRSMSAWVDALARRAGAQLDFASSGFSLGDWLDPSAPPDKPWRARVPWELVATAYLARSARIVADTAALLGHTDEQHRYQELADSATTRFCNEYVTPNGRLAFAAPTAYALALVFDLLPGELRQRAGDLLAREIAADGFHIGTGFLGTPLVCDALAETGNGDTAWAMLLQKECPSWLYAVTMGATTVWERWDSMLPDGSINTGRMTSFNHYALGAVADFLHRRVAGLAPAAPGYRRLRIAPLPSRALTWASAELQTPYGDASVTWERDGDDVSIAALVPASCDAEVLLPDGSPAKLVGAGEHRFSCTLPPERVADGPADFRQQ